MGGASFAILADGGVVPARAKRQKLKRRRLDVDDRGAFAALAAKGVTAVEFARRLAKKYRAQSMDEEAVELNVRIKLEANDVSDVETVLRRAGLSLDQVGAAGTKASVELGERPSLMVEVEVAGDPRGRAGERRSSTGQRPLVNLQDVRVRAPASPGAPKPASLMVEVPVEDSGRIELSEEQRERAERVERTLAWLAGEE